jgi:ABC-2 type transport system permease protein
MQVNLRDQGAYVGELAFGGGILVVFLFILGNLWEKTYVAQGAETLGGLTWPRMVWYVTFTEAMVLSRVNVARRVDEDVRTGDIAYALLRPGGYLAAQLGAYLAERVVRFGFTLALGSVVALLIAGPIVIDAYAGVAALTVATGAFLLEFLIVAGIGLGAFWIEDTSGVYFVYTRVSMLMGGLLIPIELFPDALAPVAKALPFAPMIHGPARLALSPDATELLAVLTSLTISTAIIGSLVFVIYRVALTRVTVHGG